VLMCLPFVVVEEKRAEDVETIHSKIYQREARSQGSPIHESLLSKTQKIFRVICEK
jgi:hypothetical protein